jgi:hypothetical protein
MIAREWFHSQMNPLMSLQIMISIETLRALVAFEGPIVGCWLMMLQQLIVIVHVLGISSISAVELWHQSMLHRANHRHLASWTMHVRHDCTLHGRQ